MAVDTIGIRGAELLKIGTVSPCEREWQARVWLVKERRHHQMVLDSRRLNRVTIKDSHHGYHLKDAGFNT